MEICELCGEEVEPGTGHELDELASEYFILDTGTLLHEECFLDSRPPSYIKAARKKEGGEWDEDEAW